MSQQVSTCFGNVASTQSFVKSCKLRAPAVSAAKRVPSLPDTPTLAGSGLSGYNVVEWNGVFLPEGTPSGVVQKVSKAVQATVADPKVNEKLRS